MNEDNLIDDLYELGFPDIPLYVSNGNRLFKPSDHKEILKIIRKFRCYYNRQLKRITITEAYLRFDFNSKETDIVDWIQFNVNLSSGGCGGINTDFMYCNKRDGIIRGIYSDFIQTTYDSKEYKAILNGLDNFHSLHFMLHVLSVLHEAMEDRKILRGTFVESSSETAPPSIDPPDTKHYNTFNITHYPTNERT